MSVSAEHPYSDKDRFRIQHIPTFWVLKRENDLFWRRIVFDSVQASQAKAVELSDKLQESRKTEHAARLTVVVNDTLSVTVRKLVREGRSKRNVEQKNSEGAKGAKRTASFEVAEGVLADGNAAVQVGPKTERARNTRKDKDKRDHTQVCLWERDAAQEVCDRLKERDRDSPSTTHFRRLPASLQLRRRALLAAWHQTTEENQSQSDDPLRQGSTDAPEIASPCGFHQSGLSGCWVVMVSDGVCLHVFVVCEWRVVWCMCRVASRRVMGHVCRVSWVMCRVSWVMAGGSCVVNAHVMFRVMSWSWSWGLVMGQVMTYHVGSCQVMKSQVNVTSCQFTSYSVIHIVTCVHNVPANRGGSRGPELAKCPVLETSAEQCQRLPRQLAGCRPTSNTGWVEHAWVVLHDPRHDAQCGCPTQWMRLWRPCRPRSRQHTRSDHGVHGRVRPWVSRQSRRNVTDRYCRGWYLLREGLGDVRGLFCKDKLWNSKSVGRKFCPSPQQHKLTMDETFKGALSWFMSWSWRVHQRRRSCHSWHF